MIAQRVDARGHCFSHRSYVTAAVMGHSKGLAQHCVRHVHASSSAESTPLTLVRALAPKDRSARARATVQGPGATADAYSASDSQIPTDQLRVVTTGGHLHDLDITPGTTTVGNIRATVAGKMGLTTDEVRLAYHGCELSTAVDDKVFEMRPDDVVLYAMRRPSAADLPKRPLTRPLTVRTMEGKDYHITVTPGITTAGEIRKAVSEVTREAANTVRLSYAGQELDKANDSKAMQFKPDLFLMHVMKLMQGGSSRSTSDVPAADTTSVGSPARRWRRHGPKQQDSSAPIGSETSSSPNAAAAAVQAFQTLDKEPQSTVVDMEPMTAPGAGSGPAAVQLAKQFRDLMKHPIPGVSAAPDDEDPLLWHVQLAGPEDTPYAFGWFKVDLEFDEDFPGCMPEATFVTKIWHPNIDDDNGYVCMYSAYGDDDIRSVACVLLALQQLLKYPNPGSPENYKCAEQINNCYEQYVETARRMTLEHAVI